MITVERLTEIAAGTVDELDLLFNELNPEHPHMDLQRLERIVRSSDTALIVARDDRNRIVGMLTLLRCTTLLTDKFWIEDVAALSEVHGRGIGRQLVETAIQTARSMNPDAKIWLTSTPKRIVARALYRSLGFEEYETGVFRL